jgi:hypothetical protein
VARAEPGQTTRLHLLAGPGTAGADHGAGAAALEHVPVPEFDDTAWSHAAFSLADPDRTRRLLDPAGFGAISIEPVVAPEYQGRDVADVASFMQRTELAQILFSRANSDQAAHAWEAISPALQPYASEEGVYLDGAAWLVEAKV